jgi:hypothetical protein
MLVRVGTMIWKEALQLWRYKLLLAFVLLFPALNMLGVAEAVSTDIMDIPSAVYDQDRSPASRRLLDMLRGSRLFAPDWTVDSPGELQRLLEEGTVKVGLVIPPGFGADLAAGRGATVQALQDGSETLTALLAEAYLEAASFVYSRRFDGGAALSVSTAEMALVEPRSRIWFNEELRK